jgi:hypothetical protein
MGKGISLHVGVNKVSLNAYRSEGALNSPVNDVRAMAEVARVEGFQKTILLLNQDATREGVLDHFSKCIKDLEEGVE